MNITTKLKMDLSKPDFGLSMDAVQGDAYSRCVNISLFNGIQPWIIPENIHVAVRYAKPDHTKGYYDTLPNGESAWSCQDNTLTVQLAPQMLTAAGDVKVQIELILGTSVLSTFRLTVHVEENPAAGVTDSEDYVNWLQWIREQSDVYVSQIHQSALATHEAAQAAVQACQNTLDTAVSVSNIHRKIESTAAEVSAIVAGNKAYTKQESDSRYSPVIHQTLNGETLFLSDRAAAPLQSLKLFGKTTQNGTPSLEAPVPLECLGESVNIMVCGKNLLNHTALTKQNVESNGSLTSISSARLTDFIPVMWDFVTASGILLDGKTNKSGYRICGYDADKKFLQRHIGATRDVYTLDVATYAYIRLCFFASELDEDTVQLEWGKIATEFESYNGGSLTLSTHNGLPGIPVTSGGNYIDQKGQQWICDEVDPAKGVYIQRIGKVASYANEEIPSVYMSNTGKLSEGATIQYALTTPIETALCTEELSAYAALLFSYPYLNIYNNIGAYMQLQYMADTKLYIDGKFNELAAAILNN